jgi:hypothetical protein
MASNPYQQPYQWFSRQGAGPGSHFGRGRPVQFRRASHTDPATNHRFQEESGAADYVTSDVSHRRPVLPPRIAAPLPAGGTPRLLHGLARGSDLDRAGMAGDDEGLGVEGVQVASRGSVLTRARGLNQELCATGSSERDQYCNTQNVLQRDVIYTRSALSNLDSPVRSSTF